jgi:hypothetical protein
MSSGWLSHSFTIDMARLSRHNHRVQFAVKLLMESTRGAIPRENGHFQIPSFVQCHFADMLGRLVAQWSPAPFFMEYAAQKRYQASFIHSYSSPR